LNNRLLHQLDLHIDQVYCGSRNGNHSDEVLPKLLGVDNGAGFRCKGSPRTKVASLRILALQTSFDDPNWPDDIDKENGIFTYYGDKREPGGLHDTKRDGNLILRNLFDFAHDPNVPDGNFPVILLFAKVKHYRDTRFLGLAVPGAPGMSSDEDLAAIWRTNAEGVRFQNYRAVFTILDVSTISRKWLNDAQEGQARESLYAPKEWLDWVSTRKIAPLKSEPTKSTRSRSEQTDLSTKQLEVIQLIHEKFKSDPYKFEQVAAEIVSLAFPNIREITVTKPWRDGGRDATGKYQIGDQVCGIEVDFAMEAKCYALNNGVGVKETSRLISRLLHRQFGILITTSYVSPQAYSEVRSDGHPIVVMAAVDISKLLINKIGNIPQIIKWLSAISKL